MPKYASFDNTVAAPSPVIGWCDTDAFDYPNLPSSNNLIEMSDSQWAVRLAGHWAVSDGALVVYTPPIDTRSQAKFVLDASDTSMHRIAEAVALGHTTWTTSDVVAFVQWRRTLRAIVSGSATTTPLPTMPAYPAGT